MGDPALPPSKFGAGYTVGGSASAPGRPTANPAGTGGGGPTGSQPASHSTLARDPVDAVHTADSPNAGMNRLAVAAFLLVLLFGPFGIPLTLPMSHIARYQIGRSGQGGAVLATAAVMLSYAYLAVGLVVLFLWLTYSPIGIRLT